jgi:hypothetical protein
MWRRGRGRCTSRTRTAPTPGSASATPAWTGSSGRGRCCHLDTPRYISFAIVHTEYNERRLNDGTAHGQAHSGVDGVQRARGAVRRAWGLLRDRPPDLAGICSDGAVGRLMSFVEISTETRFS